MRIVKRVPTLLIVIYVFISSGYVGAQIYFKDNCEPDQFQCDNGECIQSGLLCDGKADCRDMSDETEKCKSSDILCPSYAFRCKYGACINSDNVCNKVQDCVDNSDETLPECPQSENVQSTQCKENQFTCKNGQCIPRISVCDGKPNCMDKSDETEELCRSTFCPRTAFKCAYGACIDGDLKCNGVPDCVDKSDENCAGDPWPSSLPIITTTTERTRPPPSPARPPTTSNTCRAPSQPENGYWKLHQSSYQSQCSSERECIVPEGSDLTLGSRLVYSCNSGYALRGHPDVTCSITGVWLTIPLCIEIRCKPLTTASVEARCRHNNKRISCEFPVPPTTTATLQCQNSYRPENTQLSSQRNQVTCNAKGHWEPDPLRCIPVCGTIPPDVKPNVVGGRRPNITEFPWHASLYRNESGVPKKYFCGASIIKENVLLTAAHCVHDEDGILIDASKFYVLTGNIYRDYDSPSHNRLVKRNKVKRIYIVHNYLGQTGNYVWDIAILELVEPFVFTSWLVPACLDTSNDRSILEVGSNGKIAGFGRTQFGESSAILQALTVPIVSFSECKSASRRNNTEQFITIDKFCAGYTNGSSVCDGDSGGGLVFEIDNLWYLQGILSLSLGTIKDGGNVICDNYLYSLYTRVSGHMTWILEVTTKIEQQQTDVLCTDDSLTKCS